MRLVVTGGGTGGHIYPALEVARLAAERGAEVIYFGSFRGQESGVCARHAIPFRGFPSEPLLSLRTRLGIESLVKLLRARSMVRRELLDVRPDAVFSTGGYSAAPVMAAASSVRIPFVIHEANSVPGRSNRMFGKRAAGFSCTFRSTPELCPGYDIVRLGQPIRRELRDRAVQAVGAAERRQVLVVGGSQGARYLNEAAPAAAKLLQSGSEANWLLVSGPGNFEQTSAAVAGLGLARFEVEPFLQASDMADAYARSGVAIGRSGGSLAELALFRIPSVLTPLPSSADDHQLHNAREFQEMGAAKIVEQGSDHPGSKEAELYAEAVRSWMEDLSARESAQRALAEWDAPDATLNIVRMVEQAAA